MSISCCDPKKEPKPQDPNQFRLVSRVWHKVSVGVPSLIVPSGVPNGKIYAYPTIFPPGTAAADNRYSPVSGIAPLLPSAGEWALYNDGADDVSVTVFDARDFSTVDTYQKPGYTVATHSATAVGAGPVSTVALGANGERKYALFINDSANEMWLALGTTAVANTGILLQPDGGAYEIFNKSMYYGAINFIGTAADILLITQGT